MRHRERTPLRNLLAEKRNHRTRAPEHVAETHGAIRSREVGKLESWKVGRLCVEGHDRLLGGQLGLAHHGDRIDRLVRRDQHEAPHAVRGRELRQQPSRLGVVAPSLLRIHLHHRHMLVGGGMENDIRLLRCETLFHFAAVIHLAHQRDADRSPFRASRFRHPAVDLVERVLAAFDHEDSLRPRRGDLADDFAAERSACARHHHRLAREKSLRHRIVELARMTLEKLVLANAARPVNPPEDADGEDADRREKKADHRDRVRGTDVRELHAREAKPQTGENRRRKRHGADVARKLHPADAAPGKTVAAGNGQREDMDGTDGDTGNRDRPPAADGIRLVKVETEDERAKVGEADDRGIDEDPEDPRREELQPRLAGTRHQRKHLMRTARTGTARSKESNMSRKPPMPLVIFIVEESLTPTQRLKTDSIRSPIVPTHAAVTPSASDRLQPKPVTPMNAQDAPHEAKTDPRSPSQLLLGETVGHILWLPPAITFAEVSPKANPPTSENLMTAMT